VFRLQYIGWCHVRRPIFWPFPDFKPSGQFCEGGMFCQEMVKMLKNVGFERKIL